MFHIIYFIYKHSVTNDSVYSPNQLLLIEPLSFCPSISSSPSSLLVNIKEIQKETKASTTYQSFLAELNLPHILSSLMGSSSAEVKKE